MNYKLIISLLFCACLTVACGETEKNSSDALTMAANGAHRSASNISRNLPRHSVETLNFFGIEPTMAVMEIWPGSGGWYTEILAPYLRDQGTFYAANFTGSTGVQYYSKAADKFKKKIGANASVYDKVQIVDLMPPADLIPIPNNTVDLIVTFRNLHNWVNNGIADDMFEIFFKALKPGGTLGLVAHRANSDNPGLENAKTGYLAESEAIKLAEDAGFSFEEKSDINANPKDTKDYADGVWTLPPNFKKGDVDKAKYEAIGESDRMTLRFSKPS